MSSHNFTPIWPILDKEIKHPSLPRGGGVYVYPSESSREQPDSVTGNTEVVGHCLRSSYLRYCNQLIERGHEEGEIIPTEPMSTTLLWKFQASYDSEDTIINKAKTAGIWYQDHVKFQIEDLNIKGELDVVFELWDEKQKKTILVGADVKTVYGYYGEKMVFGTESERRRGLKGAPRESNIMQIALYTWYWREHIDYFSIMYFSRGSGIREEYFINVEAVDDKESDWYVFLDGKKLSWTMNNLFDRYKKLKKAIDDRVLPQREFDIQFSPDYIKALSKAGKLSKTDATAYAKKGTIKKGNWECSYCNFKSACYDMDNYPINDNLPGPFWVDHDEIPQKDSYINSIEVLDFVKECARKNPACTITIYGPDGVEIYCGSADSYIEKPLRTWARS